MIRILLPLSGLSPAISIKNTSAVVVSSGVMTEGEPSNDGRFWYNYSYTGTPGQEYHISIDAGVLIEDSENRYLDIWATEEYSPSDIASAVETAILTEGDGKAILQAIADKIGNENVSATVIATQVRTELATELSRIDVPISSIEGGTGGGGSSGVGFYMSGGQVDTKGIELKFNEVMKELKKEPDKYTNALKTASAAIIKTVKEMPQPIVSVEASEVNVQIPEAFLQEIKTIAQEFNSGAEERVKATENAYDLIMKRFRENIASDIKNAVRTDQSSFDTVIESAILRATSEFTTALASIKLEELE